MSTLIAHERRVAWAEPFSALYWRIRVQSYLLALALIAVVALGYWSYRLGTDARALVYVVAPSGEAAVVGDRAANRQPSAAEVRYVATKFVNLFWGFNSSTVHADVSAAVGLCSNAMAERLRAELAEAQFIATIRQRNIRSELALRSVEVMEQTKHYARVSVDGVAEIYSLTDYDGQPVERRHLAVELVLGVTTRNPHNRLNGLEVVRITRRADAGFQNDGVTQ